MMRETDRLKMANTEPEVSRDRWGRGAGVSWAVLAGVALLAGVLSYVALWSDDDLYYFFSCVPGHEYEAIGGLGDIIDSQNAHYLLRNGRYWVHVLVQLFCGMLGHGPFAVANGVMYLIFFAGMMRLTGIRAANVRGVVSMVALTLWAVQTRFTPSCQINYIWAFSATIWFLVFFFRRKGSTPWWRMVLLVFFSFIAGEGQEALNVGVGAALAVYAVTEFRRMTVRQWVMLAAFGAGAVVCCLAPGNFRRIDHLPDEYYSAFKCVVNLFLFGHAFWVLLLVTAWAAIRRRRELSARLRADRFYWTAALVLLAFMASLLFLMERAFLGLELVSVILMLRMLRGHTMTVPWMVILSAFVIADYADYADVSFRARRYFDEIERQYMTSPSGTVYVNMDLSSHGMANALMFNTVGYVPSGRDPLTGEHDRNIGTPNYTMFTLRKYYHHLAPANGPLVILPTFLRGKEHAELRDTMLNMYDGCVIVVRSRRCPRPFYYESTPGLFGLGILSVENTHVDDNWNLLYTADRWEAFAVKEGMRRAVTHHGQPMKLRFGDRPVCQDTAADVNGPSRRSPEP